MEAIHSNETSVLTRATWHNIPEDSNLQVHQSSSKTFVSIYQSFCTTTQKTITFKSAVVGLQFKRIHKKKLLAYIAINFTEKRLFERLILIQLINKFIFDVILRLISDPKSLPLVSNLTQINITHSIAFRYISITKCGHTVAKLAEALHYKP
jgi:hypothetical protein